MVTRCPHRWNGTAPRALDAPFLSYMQGIEPRILADPPASSWDGVTSESDGIRRYRLAWTNRSMMKYAVEKRVRFCYDSLAIGRI